MGAGGCCTTPSPAWPAAATIKRLHGCWYEDHSAPWRLNLLTYLPSNKSAPQWPPCIGTINTAILAGCQQSITQQVRANLLHALAESALGKTVPIFMANAFRKHLQPVTVWIAALLSRAPLL